MSIFKAIGSGIGFLGKNHANIDKLFNVAKAKKFDAKTLGDAALFLPFGWQVKGLIWVGTRAYASYTKNTKENELFEDISSSNDSSVSMLNNFLTEAVATNVHTSKFNINGGVINSQHTRDLDLEIWNQTTITQEFVNDLIETLFNRVYVVSKEEKFDFESSKNKDLKLKVGSNGFSANLIVRANYEYLDEYSQVLTLKIYTVVDGDQFKTGSANIELDSADVEELIEVLESKKGTSSVIDDVLAEAKNTLENVNNNLQKGYSYLREKSEELGDAAFIKFSEFSENADEKLDKLNEKFESFIKKYTSKPPVTVKENKVEE